MKMSQLAVGVFFVGLVLLGLSALWPVFVRPKTVWSDQQAQQHSQASAEVHRLIEQQVHAEAAARGGDPAHAHGATHPVPGQEPGGPEALEAAKERFRQSQAQLERARSMREGPTRVFKWLGIACALLGAAGYYALRSSDER